MGIDDPHVLVSEFYPRFSRSTRVNVGIVDPTHISVNSLIYFVPTTVRGTYKYLSMNLIRYLEVLHEYMGLVLGQHIE